MSFFKPTKYEMARNFVTAKYGLTEYPNESKDIWQKRIKQMKSLPKAELEELNQLAIKIISQNRKQKLEV